jgi:DNA-binding NarL/FixJ family response regulator
MINIVIADHQAIFRAGIAKILAVEEDLRVIGQPKSMEQLANCLERLRAKVLVVSSGFTADLSEVQALARDNHVALMVLAETAESASAYLSAGVQGLVYRSVPGESMVEAVRRLARGETYVQVASVASGTSGEDLVGERVRDRLSDKEIKIMAAVVRGYKNRDIAMQLYTSEQVIKNSLRNIFDKTGVSDRLELALFVLHHRILAQATATVHLQPEQRRFKRNSTPRTGPAHSANPDQPRIH